MAILGPDGLPTSPPRRDENDDIWARIIRGLAERSAASVGNEIQGGTRHKLVSAATNHRVLSYTDLAYQLADLIPEEGGHEVYWHRPLNMEWETSFNNPGIIYRATLDVTIKKAPERETQGPVGKETNMERGEPRST